MVIQRIGTSPVDLGEPSPGKWRFQASVNPLGIRPWRSHYTVLLSGWIRSRQSRGILRDIAVSHLTLEHTVSQVEEGIYYHDGGQRAPRDAPGPVEYRTTSSKSAKMPSLTYQGLSICTQGYSTNWGSLRNGHTPVNRMSCRME